MSDPLMAQLGRVHTGAGAVATTGASTADRARTAAREFETVFLSTVMAQMFSGIEGEGPMGTAGAGGDIWRSFLTEEYAKEISNAGGIGIADGVMRELIALQETGS